MQKLWETKMRLFSSLFKLGKQAQNKQTLNQAELRPSKENPVMENIFFYSQMSENRIDDHALHESIRGSRPTYPESDDELREEIRNLFLAKKEDAVLPLAFELIKRKPKQYDGYYAVASALATVDAKTSA